MCPSLINHELVQGDHVHLYGCLVHDQFLPFDKTSETAEIFVFLRSIVINLSMRIRFRVISYCDGGK